MASPYRLVLDNVDVDDAEATFPRLAELLLVLMILLFVVVGLGWRDRRETVRGHV